MAQIHRVAKISTSAGEARMSLKSLPESLLVLSLCSKDPETVTITGSELVADVCTMVTTERFSWSDASFLLL